MLQLVTIDLSDADIALFESYEAKVLALLAAHGGRLKARVRALDGRSETHLLFFPDAEAFDGFCWNPDRIAALDEWDRSGATAVVTPVEAVA
jgi:uncharacterized protein (DUF1330 family)